jgi:hypothetical protein
MRESGNAHLARVPAAGQADGQHHRARNRRSTGPCRWGGVLFGAFRVRAGNWALGYQYPQEVPARSPRWDPRVATWASAHDGTDRHWTAGRGWIKVVRDHLRGLRRAGSRCRLSAITWSLWEEAPTHPLASPSVIVSQHDVPVVRRQGFAGSRTRRPMGAPPIRFRHALSAYRLPPPDGDCAAPDTNCSARRARASHEIIGRRRQSTSAIPEHARFVDLDSRTERTLTQCIDQRR